MGTTDGKVTGLVPANYINILKKSDILLPQPEPFLVEQNRNDNASVVADDSQTLSCNKELLESSASDNDSVLNHTPDI